MKIYDEFNEIIDELFSVADNSPVYNGRYNVSYLKTSEKMTLALWKFVDQSLKTTSSIVTVGDVNELVRFFEQYLVKKLHIPFLGFKRVQNHQMILRRRDYYSTLFKEDYCYEGILDFLCKQLIHIEREQYYGVNEVRFLSSYPYQFEANIKEEASDFIENLGVILSDEKLKKPEPVPILILTREEYEKQFDKEREIEDDYFDFWEGTKYDAASNYEPIPPGPDQNPKEGYIFDWYKWEVISSEYKRARVNNHIIECWGVRRHKYRVDGVWVPSVTTILDKFYPFKTGSSYYNNLRTEITKATKQMKQAIFEYEEKGIECDLPDLAKYKTLKNQYKFLPIGNNLMVAYFKGRIPLYAGTIDLLLLNSDSTYDLVSLIKGMPYTYMPRVTMRENLYCIALEQCSNRRVSRMKYLQIKDSTEYYHTTEKEDGMVAEILKSTYSDYCEKYKNWEIAREDPAPQYRIKEFKLGDTVLYDGRKGIVKSIDCDNDIVELYLVNHKVIVRTTLEDAQRKEMHIVDFDKKVNLEEIFT